MNRRDLNSDLKDIDFLNKSINEFKKHAIIFIEKLKFAFENNKLVVSDIKENSFDFSFWGLKFITKIELPYNKESQTFENGEINTYLFKDDNFDLILTYKFDRLGNIENYYTEDEFGDFYYVDFIYKLTEFSSENKIKFQLK
jgi:hypothetical protein